MTYNETIEFLYNSLPVFHHIGGAAYKPGLDNTIQLLNALDNPQKKYATIHVAGTNGKGSVSHYLSAIFQAAGYKVGLYTSPHLVEFGERIRVNGKMIDKQFVIDFVEQHKQLLDTIKASFFEVTMSMAFDFFADQKVDVAIVEVGLGGRLDSTNIIEPELSVITNISYDHVMFLGNTLDKIAYEKAGIIKKNTPVVIGEELPETRPVFEQKAAEMQAPLLFAEEYYRVTENYLTTDTKLCVDAITADGQKKQYASELTGVYQLKNIATVLTAIDVLNKNIFDNKISSEIGKRIITENEIRNGLDNVVSYTGLQGRWQIIQQQPKVVCDTGHNEAGISFVCEQIRKEKFKSLRIVIGMVNDKDIRSVLALLPTDAEYYFTQASVPRALDATYLCELAHSFNLKGKSYSSIDDALQQALSEADNQDLIFVGGSNFVVGEALAFFGHRK